MTIVIEREYSHELKTIAPWFGQTWLGHKTFENRRNDRDFQVGDSLILQEYSLEQDLYSGRSIEAQVTSTLFYHISLEEYAIMSLNVIACTEA